MADAGEDTTPTPDPLIGRRIVRCPSCGTERWHGLGPCRACGAPGTAQEAKPRG